MKRSREYSRRAAPHSRIPAPPARVPVLPAPPAWVWPALLPLALAALLWSTRGAPLGTAVADDYAFLARLRFQQPLDIFDSMGAVYYWRPLSRQLYFSLVGPWLLAAPWGAALLHALLLSATTALLYRGARRYAAPPVACAVALVPLLGEATRVLLDWPSAGQHVLAMFFAVLALDRALLRDRIGAPLATLAALLSHEASFPILLALPIAAWLPARSVREALRFCALAAAVAAVWATGYAIALRHGVALPAGAEAHRIATGWPLAARFAARAALNLEDLGAPAPDVIRGGYVALGIAALALLARRATRRELRRSLPVIALGLAWFALGVTPLGGLLPDWNAWRASVCILGLVVAATVFFAAVHPALALAFVALRLVALLAATPATGKIEVMPPRTASDFSLPRLVRLQRIVDAARRALLASHDSLPAHGVVRYWAIPRLAEVAFHGSDAVRVWYADSTLAWDLFTGMRGFRLPRAALVEFDLRRPPLSAVVDPDAMRIYGHAVDEHGAERYARADSLYQVASGLQARKSGPFQASLVRNRALIAIANGNLRLGDSLNRVDLDLGGESGGTWTATAAIAYMRGDTVPARRALARALAMDPNHEGAKELAKLMHFRK